MADDPVISLDMVPDPALANAAPAVMITMDALSIIAPVTTQVYQRIFNDTTGQFHYYTQDVVNTNPLAAEVVPIAPDTNWDASKHSVIEGAL